MSDIETVPVPNETIANADSLADEDAGAIVTDVADTSTGAPSGLAARLRDALGRMLDLRSAMGFARVTYHYTLTPFIDYCGEEWDSGPLVTAPVVDGWLARHKYPSPNSQIAFVSSLRVFCRFLRFEGSDDFVPGEEYTLRHVGYDPYLLTDDELSALFDAIDSLAGRGSGKRFLPELVLPVWSRLLYCCGMRPGEPPSLLRGDVDLSTGDVYIRQSKRHKDRHIIVSDDMRDLMARYDALSDSSRTWFFELWDGRPYRRKWFNDRWRRAILPACEVEWRGSDPRPYDLRHAFCSRNIVRWMDEGLDSMRLLPALSAYVGHADLTATLYYVHLLPERLRRSPGVDWELLSEVYGRGAAK